METELELTVTTKKAEGTMTAMQRAKARNPQSQEIKLPLSLSS